MGNQKSVPLMFTGLPSQILGSASINSNMDGMGFGITVILYYYLYSKYTIDLSAYPNGDHSTTIRLFPLICLK